MKVGPLVLPARLFNRIQQPLAQEQEAQEVYHPDKKKKGKDHGPTKTLIMAVLLTCESPRVRAALTTYVVPHVLELAKEEAKRAFTAIVKEAKEGHASRTRYLITRSCSLKQVVCSYNLR